MHPGIWPIRRSAIQQSHLAHPLGVSRGGVRYALEDVPRPGAPRKYATAAEAEVVALAEIPAQPGQAAKEDYEYRRAGTRKHASWLDMAELEIGNMDKQCTGRRLGTETVLAEEVAAWQNRRNVDKRRINWTFTREIADRKLGRHLARDRVVVFRLVRRRTVSPIGISASPEIPRSTVLRCRTGR